MFLLFTEQDVPVPSCSFLPQLQELQGALVSFSGERYLETKVWVLSVLIASGTSVLLRRQIWAGDVCIHIPIHTSVCFFLLNLPVRMDFSFFHLVLWDSFCLFPFIYTPYSGSVKLGSSFYSGLTYLLNPRYQKGVSELLTSELLTNLNSFLEFFCL